MRPPKHRAHSKGTGIIRVVDQHAMPATIGAFRRYSTVGVVSISARSRAITSCIRVRPAAVSKLKKRPQRGNVQPSTRAWWPLFTPALCCLGGCISEVLVAAASGANVVVIQALGLFATLYREARCVYSRDL